MKKFLAPSVLVAALLVAGFYAFNSYIYHEKQGDPADVRSYRASLEGEVGCLPHAGDGAHTMECAFGLKTDAGEWYALDFNLLETEFRRPDTGVRFSANGLVTPVEMLGADRWRRYDIEGIFSVTDSPAVR